MLAEYEYIRANNMHSRQLQTTLDNLTRSLNQTH
jgi:hypothetical protein